MSHANQCESIFLLETHSSKSPSHEKKKKGFLLKACGGWMEVCFYRNFILIGLILINFLNGIAMVDFSNLKIKDVFWTDA